MNQRTGYAWPNNHQAFIQAVIRRAADLEQRATVSGAEQLRRAESLRERSMGHPGILRDVETIVSATEQMVAAAENLRRAIVRLVAEEPQETSWQRWRVRRELKSAIRAMERGVQTLEKRASIKT